MLVYAEVVGELVPIATDDFLHDPNLLFAISSRHTQQEDTSMWLLRMIDQLTKVSIHSEDDPLLLNHHRKSFFVNKDLSVRYLRAEYFYSNFTYEFL